MKAPGQKGPKKGGVSFGQCLVYEYNKEQDQSAVPKRVDSKDISDMRDEKTKIRDMLQEKENEQLAQIKRMQAMMNKTMSEKESFKNSEQKIEESINESMGKGKDKPTESYDTDTFEEQSKSQSVDGSSKKTGINYWPGKQAYGDSIGQSISASESKD